MELSALSIIDTNVPLVANGQSDQASDELLFACIELLQKITSPSADKRVALDEGGLIFDEYRNKLSLSGQPGTGDSFLKWVHDNGYNDTKCERRAITCLDEGTQTFSEFPASAELADFDVSDRKFVAVANAGENKLPIVQAVDFKWWGWREALMQVGIEVQFVSPEEAEAGYQAHLPGS